MHPSWQRTLLSLVLSTLAAGAAAQDYAAARARLVAAYQAADYPAMQAAARDALAARPGYPGALFNLALAQALGGEAESALGTLLQLADLDIDFGADTQDEFQGLHALPGWADYRRRLEGLRAPRGEAATAFELAQGDFVPEGIALADPDTLYLGSIRHGRLVRLRRGEAPQVLSDPARGGHWGVFGMRLDDQGGLWFASAAVAQMAGLDPQQVGRSGLFRLDLAGGQISHRALLPQDGAAHVLGDLVLGADGTVYTTDSLTGAVFRYCPQRGEFETLVAPGRLGSPQGLALDPQGTALYVADYTGGLYRLELASRALQPVSAPATVSLYGVDGLYRQGSALIAIQNGIRPHRVVRWQLDSSGARIIGAQVLAMNLPEFDEPTLGTVLGEGFYFVANSHWNRFERDNALPEGLAGPLILHIDLARESE